MMHIPRAGELPCGYGGIGRRAGFRCQWFTRVGSNPTNRIVGTCNSYCECYNEICGIHGFRDIMEA